MDSVLKDKLDRLRSIVGGMEGVLVAFSGGVDSSFLLAVAVEALGGRAVGVTAVSATYAAGELDEARGLAASIGARHVVIETDELADRNFADNPPERCYHCKRELFGKLAAIARAEGLPVVADATNVDDQGDYRPGRRAAAAFGVRSPLIEAGLTKADVRALSREMGLPTWSKPAAACLASRFPYGEAITEGKLRRVEAAEAALRRLGFDVVRVRSHGQIARIEVEAGRVAELAAPAARGKVDAELRALGFAYVTLDLSGYRTGSMNEVLPHRRAGG